MHALQKDTQIISSLPKRADFLRLNKTGKRWVSQGFVLQVLERTPEDHPDIDPKNIRVGITITKKIFKSAVKRNRVKRRLRAIAAEVLPARAKANCDYVLIGRNTTIDRPYEALKKDLTWCLRKMGYDKPS